ncbi:hypothetical protein OQA88_9620 [Cercophora sp. LCS_1]
MEPPPPPTPPPSQSPSATLQTLPLITHPHTFTNPQKRINDGPDVSHFLTSLAYRDIGTFVLQLNHAMIPRRRPPPAIDTASSIKARLTDVIPTQTYPANAPRDDPEIVRQLAQLLKRVEGYIAEAPLDPGPRRFGNIGFRTWHKLVEERADELLKEFLGDVWEKWGDEAMQELKAYFLGSFGSSQRLDYGTGHELSFLAFLGALWKLGAFPTPEGRVPGQVERCLVLGVIEPYLHVVRKLIMNYTLEPAGSHGVWGLDDHSFLPYIFGSAQLAKPLNTENDPTPIEGSAPHAPRPSDVTKPDVADAHRSSWMYFSAVAFINDVKKGPFWEHSPILFDISGIRDGWGKINKGMIKMFNAEVLSKFPVVQHFPFGSLFSWDADPEAKAPAHSIHLANQPTTMMGAPGAGAGTAAPWAQATSMPGGLPAGPGIPYSQHQKADGKVAGPRPGRGGAPNTGPPPPSSFPQGVPGTASNQHAVTKAPWAK